MISDLSFINPNAITTIKLLKATYQKGNLFRNSALIVNFNDGTSIRKEFESDVKLIKHFDENFKYLQFQQYDIINNNITK